MKTKLQYFFIALALFAGVHQAAAQGTTAFTYQGQLHDNGTNANGAYTMIFKLYDSSSAGNLIGNPNTITTSTTLANGLFTVNLDFGAGAFNGGARYLDITVTNGGTIQELSPRVQVLPTPYAQFAAVAATVTNGSIMNAQLAGNAVASTNIQNGAITTTQIANGAVTNANLTSNAVATTNIQNGAITDSKIASMTTLMFCSETNLRVIRGSLFLNGGVTPTNSGGGYTYTYSPPGSGATFLGYYQIYSDGNGNYYLDVDNNNHDDDGLAGTISPGAWISVNGQGNNFTDIFQVQSADNAADALPNDIVIYGTGSGQYTNGQTAAVYTNPSLVSTWNITFTAPFSDIPTIVASSRDGNNSNILPHVSINRSKATAGANFTATVGYDTWSFPTGSGFPVTPPSGDGFEFIAIGPK